MHSGKVPPDAGRFGVEGMKRWAAFFLPGGVLFCAAVLAVQMPSLKTMIPPVMVFAPYLVFVSAALIGWRFNRSSLVFAVLILACADRALLAWAKDLPGIGVKGQLVFHAAAFLVPLNLIALSLMKERGIFTFHGAWRISLIILQPVTLAAFARLHSEPMLAYLTMAVIPWPFLERASLAQPALIAFILAFLILGIKFMINKGAKESGFFWALLTLFWAFLSVRPGMESGFYFTVAGFILLVSIIEASHAMAFRDELTGLPARRALKEDLLKLGNHYALAMVDIDHFKQFNDTYGHDVGDQVLRMVATKLARVSGGGKSFRYGGEEFTVIFSGRYADHAKAHLEDLRKEVESTDFIIRRRMRPRKKPKRVREAGNPLKSVSVTISIGMACRDEKNHRPQEVIKAADKALYRAKKQGRNRLCT